MEKQDECLIHYGVLGMKWGVRKMDKHARKSAYDKRRAEYNKHLANASESAGNVKTADKYRKKARKYETRASEHYKKLEREADKVWNKSLSEKNQKKRLNLAKEWHSEGHKIKMANIKATLANSKNMDMAFKEAGRREDNRKSAITAAVGAGAAVISTLVTGGFFATPAVSAAASSATKIGMDHFTVMNGETVFITAAGQIIRKH